ADRPAVFDRQISSFVGRESEMGLLGHRWALAQQGLGQVVGVVGDPGIGKSRLIWEFLRREVTRPSLVLETACAALGRPTPYLAVIGLLRAYFKVEASEGEWRVRERVPAAHTAFAAALVPPLPALLSSLDFPVHEADWDPPEPPGRPRHTLEAVKRLMVSESARQPLLLVFEDA